MRKLVQREERLRNSKELFSILPPAESRWANSTKTNTIPCRGTSKPTHLTGVIRVVLRPMYQHHACRGGVSVNKFGTESRCCFRNGFTTALNCARGESTKNCLADESSQFPISTKTDVEHRLTGAIYYQVHVVRLTVQYNAPIIRTYYWKH